MYVPFHALPRNYDEVTWIRGSYSPVAVKSFNNAAFAFWERSLYQRALSVFSFELPNNWQGSIKDFFHWCLFGRGFIYVGRNEKYGYFFQPCTTKGFDFYYQPTEALVANPQMSATFKLHEDGELLKLTPDFVGIGDIIDYYAEKLATIDVSINSSIINSKLAYLLAAKNKTAAEALKTIMDRVNRGEPAVFYDKTVTATKATSDETPFQFLPIANIKNNYVLDCLLREMQTILNAFDAEIGIKTIPYQKAERMVTGEAESKTQDSQARVKSWCDCLDASLKDIKELFPDIKLSYKLTAEEVEEDGNSENDLVGNAAVSGEGKP